jgi:hypothetical protein
LLSGSPQCIMSLARRADSLPPVEDKGGDSLAGNQAPDP